MLLSAVIYLKDHHFLKVKCKISGKKSEDPLLIELTHFAMCTAYLIAHEFYFDS